MSQSEEDLQQFRDRIDAIDDQLVALLKQRISIVREVGEHKAQTSATQSFIRAGREATMLRKLTDQMKGDLPPVAVATIWRMIISSSLCTEQNMSIAVYGTPEYNTCLWRAREYYGAFIDISTFDTVDEVINNVAEGVNSIGILPINNGSDSPWWLRPPAEKNNIYVFARIPFIVHDGDQSENVFAIANVNPEPTEYDTSIIVIHNCNDSNGALELFSRFGFKITIIASHNSTNHLVEADRFISMDDATLQNIEQSLGDGAYIRLMGSYATPIELDTKS